MTKAPYSRNIRDGWEIPTETYSDQPYIVTTDDGAWLCAVTTGNGHEGQTGQHVVTLRSVDMGQTWSAPVDVEPADGPEASYAVLLKVPQGYANAGRIYVFYNHNTDNVRKVKADTDVYPDGYCRRVDSLGHFVFKFSDDHGLSWSKRRYDVPMRVMDIDRRNAYGGELKFFWNVGKPFIYREAAYVSVHKVGGFGEGFFTRSEGILLRSAELLSNPNPEAATWQTLPDGEFGLRTPEGGGPIAEEQSYTVLSDGSFYAVYRTIDGYPVESYSRDEGHTWSQPHYKAYADGRLMKHPRAATFVWRLSNGSYLTWFHNHGGRFILEHPQRRGIAYEDRNPVWFSAGIEIDTPEGKVIRWSEPEIGLYDDDPYIRMSYPDLVEADGHTFLTETQKDIARVHEISPEFLGTLCSQFEGATITTRGLVLSLPVGNAAIPPTVPMPRLPDFLERDRERHDYGTKDLRNGFSVDIRFNLSSFEPDQILLDNRADDGHGFCLRTTLLPGDTAPVCAIELILNDGRTENRWSSDPDLLKIDATHHVVVVVDGGPKVISFVVDGKFNDGGTFRQFGWGRFSPNLRDVNGAETLRIGPNLKGDVLSLRLYNRYLLTSEAIGNFRAGV